MKKPRATLWPNDSSSAMRRDGRDGCSAADVTSPEHSLQRLVRGRGEDGIYLDFSEYDWEPSNNRGIGFEIIYGSTNWDGRKIAGVFIANTGSGLHPDTLVCEKTGQSVDGGGGASVPDNDGVSYWAKHPKIAVETGNIDREVLERSKLAALNGSKDVGFHSDVIESPNNH